MKIEPGMIVDGCTFYKAGDRLRIRDAGNVHECVFVRAHPSQQNPKVMTLRVKSLDGEKYAIGGNLIESIERITP